MDLLTFFKRMASNAKHAKCDSVADDLISSVRRSYFEKTADEEFFTNLKSIIELKAKSHLILRGFKNSVYFP